MSLPPEMIAYQLAHKDDNNGYQLIVTSTIFGFLALTCVTARVASRMILPSTIGLDDYLIMGAMFFGIALVISTCLMGVYGVGRHLATISPDDLLKFGKVNLALQTSYPFTIGLARLSILALYHRLFSKAATRLFAAAIWFCVIYNILWIIGILLVVYLQCHPLSKLWTGQCAPQFKTTLSTSVLNIIGDAMVLALPQPILWSLKLPVQRKIGVSLIMLLGLFTVVISIARIFLIKDGGNKGAMDITYTSLNTFIFTVLEPMVAIICACLPIMPAVLRYAISSIRGLSVLQSLSRTGGSKSQLNGTHSSSNKSLNSNYMKMDEVGHAKSHVEIHGVESQSQTPSLKDNQIWVSRQANVDVSQVV